MRQLHALVGTTQRQAAELVDLHCNASALASKLHSSLEAKGAAGAARSNLACEADVLAAAQCEEELHVARQDLAKERAAAGLNGRLGALEQSAVRRRVFHWLQFVEATLTMATSFYNHLKSISISLLLFLGGVLL